MPNRKASKSKRARLRRRERCLLRAEGWTPRNRSRLEELLTRGANRSLPAVFDFDNTLVFGDIGEATMAVLARSGMLTPSAVPEELCPAFRTAKGHLVRVWECEDVTEYYEALLAPTAHGARDPHPLANGYAWVTQVMTGLQLKHVVNATRTAFEWTDPAKPGFIEVTPGRTAYPVPIFYPPMVELLRELLRLRFDVWIVSASNVWSVRWMVLNALNPLLRRRGVRVGVRADHVIGISTLLADRRQRLYKEAVLVSEDKGYAQLQTAALNRFTLTSQLQYPVSAYSGKVSAIFDLLGRNPYLAAGDSPGDLPMMALSAHRLWIARPNKPAYQALAASWVKRTGPEGWIIQPAFAADPAQIVKPGSRPPLSAL